MERFLSNYKPPPPKKSKLSEEEQLEKNRKYETEKRKRAFNPSWKNTFGWLDYHVVNGKVKCFARYVGATITPIPFQSETQIDD